MRGLWSTPFRLWHPACIKTPILYCFMYCKKIQKTPDLHPFFRKETLQIDRPGSSYVGRVPPCKPHHVYPTYDCPISSQRPHTRLPALSLHADPTHGCLISLESTLFKHFLHLPAQHVATSYIRSLLRALCSTLPSLRQLCSRLSPSTTHCC